MPNQTPRNPGERDVDRPGRLPEDAPHRRRDEPEIDDPLHEPSEIDDDEHEDDEDGIR